LLSAELIVLIRESVAAKDELHCPVTEPQELAADCKNAPILLTLIPTTT
jgi:hypothetical protein